MTEIEAAVVRHYTSRASDPHRHLHVQINARVLAEGAWRGLHSVGMRDSLAAINGIGHAAVTTDPEFRAELAAHGFTLDDRARTAAQQRRNTVEVLPRVARALPEPQFRAKCRRAPSSVSAGQDPFYDLYPRRDSNPRYRLERAAC